MVVLAWCYWSMMVNNIHVKVWYRDAMPLMDDYGQVVSLFC